MTELYPEDLLRREVERKLPIYEDYSEEQLLAEISQLELGSQFKTRHRLEGIVEAGAVTPEAIAPVMGLNLSELGSWFMKGSSFHDTICEPANKDLIKGIVSFGGGPGGLAGVPALVKVLLPMFGIAAPPVVITFVVPAGIVALAVLLIRYGIEKYCT